MERFRPFRIKNRYIVLACIVLGIVGWIFMPPVLPHIQVPAEAYPSGPLFTLPIIGDFYWTNTLTAMLIADILLVIIAVIVRRAAMSGELIPSGFSGAFEAIVEAIYNLTESTAGKWAAKIFPFFATLFLLVLIVNWTELIPGVDTVGFLEEAEDHGYPVEQVVPGVYTIVEPEEDTEHGEEQAEHGFTLIPFVRTLSTDLNFTLALALVSVTMTQVFGVQSLGFDYFSKFINIKGFSKNPVFGGIDFFVGLLELISEFSKIISFSFRLFGNIFAGTVLLFVIGSLLPVIVPSIFLMLEFFVGVIQALVFGMLTMVFMSMAVAGHGDHGEETAH